MEEKCRISVSLVVSFKKMKKKILDIDGGCTTMSTM